MEEKNALILAELLEDGKRTVFVRGGNETQKLDLLYDFVLCLLKSGLHKALIKVAVDLAFAVSDSSKKTGMTQPGIELDTTIEKLYSQITPEDFARANAEGL